MRTYTTIQGDMWDSIAYSQLGSTDYTDDLMRANTSLLGFYIFPTGVVLKLPDISTAVNSEQIPPWKRGVWNE